MSRRCLEIGILSTLLGGLAYFGVMTNSMAGVNIDVGTPNINISIRTPPPVVGQSPPPMAVIPGSYVYIATNVGVNLLFYHGQWYRPHEGHWFSAPSYKGPWAHVAPARVPRAIVELPPGYHRLPPGHQRIPYEQVKGNWEKWEREKHWQKDKEWQEGGKGGREMADRKHKGTGHR